MKVYLYCVETGVYQGEDFAETTTADRLAPGATPIAPPPYERGEVPVYLLKEGCWKLRSKRSGTGTGTGSRC